MAYGVRSSVHGGGHGYVGGGYHQPRSDRGDGAAAALVGLGVLGGCAAVLDSDGRLTNRAKWIIGGSAVALLGCVLLGIGRNYGFLAAYSIGAVGVVGGVGALTYGILKSRHHDEI